jgi:hypothetical protein
MRRIRTIVLLETLLIAFAISSAQAIPVWGPDGVPGHLATVASAVDSFLATLTPIGWLGGTDQVSAGPWTWADGLQPNQAFGIAGPRVPGGVHPNWVLGQADSGGTQNFLRAPEPGTFLLFGAALAGVGLAGWHQRRRARALGRTEP